MLYTPYIWPLIVASALMSGVCIWLPRFKGLQFTRLHSSLMMAGAGWALSCALSISTTLLPYRVFLGNCMLLCELWAAISGLLLAIEYAGRGAWLNNRRIFLLASIPAVLAVVIFTSLHHTLFRYNFHLDLSNSFSGLLFSSGPLYAVFIGYAIFSILGSAVLVGGRYAEITHVTRSKRIENIHDLVIVVDSRMRIMDANRSAKKVMGLPIRRPAGMAVDGLLPAWADIFQNSLLNPERQEEVIVDCMDGCHTYTLTITPLLDYRLRQEHYLFLLHDITGRKSIQVSLQESLEMFRCLAEKAAFGKLQVGGRRYSTNCPAYERATAYTSDEMDSLEVVDLSHTIDYE